MIGASANAVDLGPRVACWMRDTAFPGPFKAKRIAREFDVSEGTAKLWLGGKRPEARWLELMAHKWGWRFVAFVYSPICGPDENALLTRIEATERHALQVIRETQEVRALIERQRLEHGGQPVGQIGGVAEPGGAGVDREVAPRALTERRRA